LLQEIGLRTSLVWFFIRKMQKAFFRCAAADNGIREAVSSVISLRPIVSSKKHHGPCVPGSDSASHDGLLFPFSCRKGHAGQMEIIRLRT
jgi:hypothetical protein